jgi:hypothetical protein
MPLSISVSNHAVGSLKKWAWDVGSGWPAEATAEDRLVYGMKKNIQHSTLNLEVFMNLKLER